MTLALDGQARHVAILGCGAIGGWLAGALTQAGCAVSIIARGETLAVLKRDGLTVRDRGRERRHRLEAGSHLAELTLPDVLILAVKAHTLTEALPRIAGALRPETEIVSAMNGVPWWFFQGVEAPLQDFVPDRIDAQACLRAAFSPARVSGAVIHASARTPAPAVIELIKADRLILGRADGSASVVTQALAERFRAGGIVTEEV